MRIFIITWCKTPEAVYGNRLTIDSVRVGFPDAEVVILDNGSTVDIGESPFRRERLAERPHHELVRWLIEHLREPFVILDPDLIFHRRFLLPEAQLLAGRRLPAFFDPYSRCITHARLHTSLLVVPDPPRLARMIRDVEQQRFEADLVGPRMYYLDGGWWHRFDTLAQLDALMGSQLTAFGPAQLDAYDHLFCGTSLHLTQLPELYPVHALAKANPGALKGLYKQQDAWFAAHEA